MDSYVIKARINGSKREFINNARLRMELKEETVKIQDISFKVPHGRLILREIQGKEEAQLIFYKREGINGHQDCHISKCHDAANLFQVLSKPLNTNGRLTRVRPLLIMDQIRIIIDYLDGIGLYIDLEVALKRDQTKSDGEKIAKNIMKRLGIEESQMFAFTT